MKTNPPLYEQYRPRTWGEVIGQDKTVKKIQAMSKRGLAGRAYWITDASGTGKGCISRLLALEIADAFNVAEVDASEATPVYFAKLEDHFCFYGFGKLPGKVIIINEAHGLRKDSIRQLLVFLERLPSHCAVIFCTTSEGQGDFLEDHIDANPLLSRCIRLDLARRDLAAAFAARAREIAVAEGLDGRGPEDYLKLVKRSANNFRAVLQSIESGEMLS